MSDLPRPNFIERSPQVIEAEQIALYQTILDKTLYPGQAELLLLNALTYRETSVRVGIQDGCEQSLVNYAREGNLDQLGAFLGVVRLPASKATTVLEFERSPVTALGQLIPAGTRVAIGGGAVSFATIADATIPANEATVSVVAEASLVGAIGNGFLIGQINQMLDVISGVTAANTTFSSGGAEVEGDERFRARIKLAPNQFSVAGSTGSYRYFTLSADQLITDVAILSPRRVLVQVYILTTEGLPSAGILAKVEAALTGEMVRPLNDEVEVLAPVEVNYSIEVNITLYSNADSGLLSSQLDVAGEAYENEKRSGLGKDIVRSQIISALSLTGVYSVSVVAPAADLAIAPNEWANCTSVNINVVGTNDG